MLTRFFQEELAALRERGLDFAKNHPALAPLLGRPSSDPDVERLLEGTAFLTASLREKLADDFPEVVHDLLDRVAPEFLQPIPASTILVFERKPTVTGPLRIPAGTHVASAPVDGTPCLFRTAVDVTLPSVRLAEARAERRPGRPAAVVLRFASLGEETPGPRPPLRLHLADDYPAAAELYRLLLSRLARVVVDIPGRVSTVLPPGVFRPVGLGPEAPILPYPSNAFPGLRCVQEYFHAPEKFLFLDLAWDVGAGGPDFTLRCEFTDDVAEPPRVGVESFCLGATPAVNVFAAEAEPIRLDHRRTHYAVRPSGGRGDAVVVHSVVDVRGFPRGGGEERRYRPFTAAGHAASVDPLYHLSRRRSAGRPGIDLFLSVAYPGAGALPTDHALSVRLLCTNGALPDRLEAGDVKFHTDNTPEGVAARNLRAPRPGVIPPIGRRSLASLHGLLVSQIQSWDRPEVLREALALFLYPDLREDSAVAHRRRIDGIQGLRVETGERFFRGSPLRGREIHVDLRESHFAGPGDAYVFASLLDLLFANRSSINTYTRLHVRDGVGGRSETWPARVGNLSIG
jgi:type VI secretion system protein ImpG